jgi:hypothetical protein
MSCLPTTSETNGEHACPDLAVLFSLYRRKKKGKVAEAAENWE